MNKVLKADESVVVSDELSKLVAKNRLIIGSGVKLSLGKAIAVQKINADSTCNYPRVLSWPVGSFDNEMRSSEAGSVFPEGTFNDGVFSYTQAEATSPYVRTHKAWLSNVVSLGDEDDRTYIESTEDKDLVIMLLVAGLENEDHKTFCSQTMKKTATPGVLNPVAEGAYDVALDANEKFTYEGNREVGYYWRPENYVACNDVMKKIYNELAAGTLYESKTSWSVGE